MRFSRMGTLWSLFRRLNFRPPTGPFRFNLPGILTLLAFLLGIFLLLGSYAFPWFQVPVTVKRIPDVGFQAVYEEASVTTYFKYSVLGVLGISTLFYILGLLKSRQLVPLFSILLACLLFFPTCVLHFSNDLAAVAGWLQRQHHNLTWLGGDIFTGQEEAFADFRSHIYVVDPPPEIGSVSVPYSLPYLFQFGLLSEYSSWFGYTEAFSLFMRKGWVLAIGGCVLLSLTLCKQAALLELSIVRSGLRSFGLTFLLLACIGLIPIGGAAYHIGKAEVSVGRGEAEKAYARLEKACKFMPILADETTIVIQKCLLAYRAGFETAEAKYYRARLLEQHGLYQAAEQLFFEVFATPENLGPLYREVRRSLLRQAIHRLNSNQVETAYRMTKGLMLRDPCALKANYVLQLICLRTARYDEVRSLDEMLQTTYRGINALNKGALLAFSRENVSMAQYLAGKTESALSYKIRAVR